MDNAKINLLKLKLKNEYKKKQEIKTQILKSIVQNQMLPLY